MGCCGPGTTCCGGGDELVDGRVRLPILNSTPNLSGYNVSRFRKKKQTTGHCSSLTEKMWFSKHPGKRYDRSNESSVCIDPLCEVRWVSRCMNRFVLISALLAAQSCLGNLVVREV